MCGIVGIIGRSSDDLDLLKRMSDLVAHRGPDGMGVIALDRLALGHRRLAILDARRGQQPLEYMSRYVVSYNGEIYNHTELRRELEADGYRFSTSTDTEVIPAAYDRWGPSCLTRFNGMWAFALYDRLSRKILLARDRFGEKPLFYCRAPGSFVFASEIKALFLHPGVQRRPRMDYARRYLALGPQEHLEETAFEGVRRLPNASYVEAPVDEFLSGSFRVHKFWSLTANSSDEPFDASKVPVIAGRYFELLKSAVDLRRHADVELGATLSGGLDSSSVAWLMVEGLKQDHIATPLPTFSSVYTSPDSAHCDESAHIQTLAQNLPIAANVIEPRCDDVIQEHRAMMWHMDTPPESTLMSSWHTYKCVARTDVRVVLEGQGADEQLAGYARYLINALAWSDRPLRDFRASTRMGSLGLFPAVGLAAHASRRVGLPKLPVRVLRAFKKNVYDGSTLNEALVRDSMTSLQTLLHYADRASMAYSIESRLPFLDHRLAEFLATVPGAYKMHDGWTKYLARTAFNDKLPPSITWRRDKMGWNIPEDVWFRGPLRGWIEDQITSSSLLHELEVRWQPCQLDEPGSGVNSSIRLLNLATWHRLHIEREAAPAVPERLVVDA
jgi:asparagine synthase (glutamine-hydrolysing)